jgi:hypothetical protein
MPVGNKLQVVTMILTDNLPSSVYAGYAAYYEGYDNHLSRCPSCLSNSLSAPSSVMGSQGPTASNQPTAPTICDKYFYAMYKGF